jgi:alpha-tubulin suppressor-like RCC1 family protein
LASIAVSVLPAGAGAEQASQPDLPAAGELDVGSYHSCALLAGGAVRCWGFSGDGQLGYANKNTIGDDETPASAGPVDLGPGHTATDISSGDSHTCALLEDKTVRCWGFGIQGRLGYGNQNDIGDDEAPGSAGRVDLGGTATAIAAGGAHTCAILTGGTVRCWGFGGNGQLGYGNTDNIGDNEPPGSIGSVNLGAGRTAVAITAGELHTCALLDNGTVRCWGFGVRGELGYGSTENVGDTPTTTPDTAGPVNLGMNLVGTRHTAKAITAGDYHTCALLDDNTVRCWGFGIDGRLGYGNEAAIGDNETPDMAGPVALGGTAAAIAAGGSHTCAILTGGTVRCWGQGSDGQLGYGNTATVGDAPSRTPDTVGPVNLGPGRTALAISAGLRHTCARLDDDSVRCWGYGANGRLGYCNESNIGDDELPGSVGPVDIGSGGFCAPAGGAMPAAGTATSAGTAQSAGAKQTGTVASDAARARGLRDCLAAVAAHARRERRLAGHGSALRRARARRHLSRHARSGRRRCLRLFGRVPGAVTGLRAQRRGKTQIELDFNAAGTDGNRPPPARSYVVKQSLGPIRGPRGFARAQTLCNGVCRFTVSSVGAQVTLGVTDLRPHTTYYYAVAARDNVSARRGPISGAVKASTR